MLALNNRAQINTFYFPWKHAVWVIITTAFAKAILVDIFNILKTHSIHKVNVLKFRTLYSILFRAKFCCFFMQLFLKILGGMANSVDHDQRAVWSGSALFAYVIFSDTLVLEILGYLPKKKKKKKKKYWDLLQLSQSASVNSVHAYKPILAFKRPKNLRDYLVHSSFVDETHHFSQTCDRRRCSHCKNIIKTDVFTSRSTQASFKMRFSTSCTSQNVIYLVECKRCNMQYIGQTNQQVSRRMNSHRFDINTYDGQGYATNVALHFNSDSHSVDDFRFVPIDVVNNEMDRLCKETYWIHKLDTLYPKGMNSKLLYTIK